MKVFLSWSGETSKAAATALHVWLPTVIQTVRPYMSAESIDKGERWSVDISKQLEETHFGIICITPSNIEAPWVLFEAGALSKSMEKARVSPLLFGVGPTDFTGSPLLQFQLTLFKKEDFAKLLQSINAAAPDNEKLSPEVLNKSFERAWDELESEIARINFSSDKSVAKAKKAEPSSGKLESVLDELLTIARSQMKVLRSPEDVLPPAYLVEIMERARIVSARPDLTRRHPVWSDLRAAVEKALEHISRAETVKEDRELAVKNLEQALGALSYIQNRLYDRADLRPRAKGFWPLSSSRTIREVRRLNDASDVDGSDDSPAP